MITKSHLASNSLVSIGSQLIWGAQAFITFVMAGWLLPQKEFGLVVVANAVLFGSQCLLLGPVTNPTLRFGATSVKSVRVTYWIYLAVTAIVCSIFVLLGEQVGGLIYKDPSFFTLVKYLSIPFATTTFFSMQKLILFARLRYKTVLMMDILFAGSNVATMFWLQSSGMLSSAISFYMARSGAAVLGLLPVVVLHVWPRRTAAPRNEECFDYKDYFEHSKYSLISMLSGYGQGQVDVLAVAHFLSPLGAATYGAAKIFYTGLWMVTTGFVMVTMPASSRIAASGEGGMGVFYRRALVIAYAILVPTAAVIALLADPLLKLCFGDRYGDAAPIVRIFCLAAFLLPVSSITDAVANGAGWFRSAFVASITGAAIGVVASLSLTRSLGLSGAALAPVLGLCGSSCVIAWLTWGRLITSSSTPMVGNQAAALPAVGNE